MSNAITPALVKELREKTGAGIMDCKSSLVEANGDIEAAIEILRKKGLKDVGKRAGKVAAEGTVGVYQHTGNQIVAIIELNCETDFVARGDDFQQAASDLAMHVAAMQPQYIAIEDVPKDFIEKEEAIALESLNEGQKAKADKILPGKMAKVFEEIVLLEQPFVKDEKGKQKVSEVIEALSVKCGEKVSIQRFIRYQVGELVEKVAEQSFADEVAATIGGN